MCGFFGTYGWLFRGNWLLFDAGFDYLNILLAHSQYCVIYVSFMAMREVHVNIRVEHTYTYTQYIYTYIYACTCICICICVCIRICMKVYGVRVHECNVTYSHQERHQIITIVIIVIVDYLHGCIGNVCA